VQKTNYPCWRYHWVLLHFRKLCNSCNVHAFFLPTYCGKVSHGLLWTWVLVHNYCSPRCILGIKDHLNMSTWHAGLVLVSNGSSFVHGLNLSILPSGVFLSVKTWRAQDICLFTSTYLVSWLKDWIFQLCIYLHGWELVVFCLSLSSVWQWA